MKKGIACILLFVSGFCAFSQQSYSWEGQAKEIITQAEEILTDTTDQVAAFKESLQSMVRESFQVNESYRKAADSLKAEIDKMAPQLKTSEEKLKSYEKLKVYVLYGGGGLVLVLVILTILFLIRSSKATTRYRKAFSENKELHSVMSKNKEEAEQLTLKMERIETELKDSLEDIQALNNKNKNLLQSESDLKTSLEKTAQEKENLVREKDDLLRKNSELQNAVDSSFKELAEVRHEQTDLLRKAELLTTELASVRSSFEAFRTQKEHEMADIHAKGLELEKILDQLRSEYTSYQGRVKEQVLSIEAKNDEYRAEVIALKNSLFTERVNAEKLNEKIGVLAEEIHRHEQEYAALLEEYKNLEDTTTSDRQHAETLLAERQSMAQEMTTLYNQSLLLEKENSTLKAEVESLRANIEKEVQARVRIDRELERFVEELKGFLPLP